MESEKEFIIHQFQKSFGKDEKKRIVIYGIGECTKDIIEHFTKHQIIGVMHYDRLGEIWYGKRIISFEEAKDQNADCILIVARAMIIRTIYNRIYGECEKIGIPIYDIHGHNLTEYYGNRSDHELNKIFDIDSENLKSRIKENDVISFDIFDTLITRKVLYPTDVFHLIQRDSILDFDFYAVRREAELTLLKTINPNIYQIYDRIAEQTGISLDEAACLREKEIKLEKSIITPRKEMIDIFKFAKQCHKEIYLVSDMYLTKDILEEILEQEGITGYRELIVSCEYGTSKTGYLFSKLREACEDRNCLHIGDNLQADIESAKNNGFLTFYVPSGLDLLKASAYREVLSDIENLENRMILGLLTEQLFNSPFHRCDEMGRVIVDHAYDFSYGLIAPFVTKYVHWLLSEIIDYKPDYVIFPSRDGFLLQRLYEKLRKDLYTELPEGKYFYTSRMAAMLAGIENEQDILEIAHIGFNGTTENMLQLRFLIDAKEIMPYNKDIFESEDAYVLAHKKIIFKKAEKKREYYLQYIEKFQFKENGKIVFCDFVSSGTCQKNLSRLIPAEFLGLYAFRLYHKDVCKQTLHVKSLYKNNTVFTNDEYIIACYCFMELIFSSDEPSLQTVESGGHLCFCEESRTDEQIVLLKEFHQAITDFLEEYTRYLPKTDHGKISLKLCDTILSFLQNNFTDIRQSNITNSFLPDEICNVTFNLKGIFSVVPTE